MVIWTGRGILVIIVPLLCNMALVNILPYNIADYGIVAGFYIGGAFSWFMGNKWNNIEGQVFVDKETNEEVEFKPNHSLFWIPMQYWGYILGGFATYILYQNLTK
jgi:hypothetical protein